MVMIKQLAINEFIDILTKLLSKKPITHDEAYNAMSYVCDGMATTIETMIFIKAPIVGRKPDGQELLGYAKALRDRQINKFEAPPGTIDICGTGGKSQSLRFI